MFILSIPLVTIGSISLEHILFKKKEDENTGSIKIHSIYKLGKLATYKSLDKFLFQVENHLDLSKGLFSQILKVLV